MWVTGGRHPFLARCVDSGGPKLVKSEKWGYFLLVNFRCFKFVSDVFCWICWSVFPWTKYCILVLEIHGGKRFRPNYVYTYIYIFVFVIFNYTCNTINWSYWYIPRDIYIYLKREIFLCRKYLYRAGVLVSLKIQPPFFNMDEYLPQKRFFQRAQTMRKTSCDLNPVWGPKSSVLSSRMDGNGTVKSTGNSHLLEASGTSVSCTSPMLSKYVLKNFLGPRKHIQKCGFEGILEDFECPLPLKKLRCPLSKNSAWHFYFFLLEILHPLLGDSFPRSIHNPQKPRPTILHGKVPLLWQV